MKYFPKLNGENLYLALSSKEDLPLYTKWLNDPELNLTYGRSHIVYNINQQEKYIEDYNNSDDKFFFVIVKRSVESEDIPIGIGLLYDIDYIHGKGSLGILIDSAYQGNGYGKESVKLLLEFGFNILNLNNMMLYAIDFNQKAIKLYESLGFKIIGKRRNAYSINNKVYSEVYMDILKSEFNQD